MPKGGVRKGAGRPRGSLTKRTREIAERTTRKGLTPLEFLLAQMHNPELSSDAQRDAAKAAAPFIHPRLSSMEVRGEVTLTHEARLKMLK